MESMPYYQPDWKTIHRKGQMIWEYEEFDPGSHVRTTWRRNFTLYEEERTDRIMGSPLSRNITRSTHPNRPIDARDTTYRIEQHLGINSDKEIILVVWETGTLVDEQPFCMTINTGRHSKVAALYDREGNLEELAVSHLDFDQIKQLPTDLETEIKDLTQLYVTQGEAALYPPRQTSRIDYRDDESGQQAKENAVQQMEENLKKQWPKGMRGYATSLTREAVYDLLIRYLASNLDQREIADAVVQALITQVMTILPLRTELFSFRPKPASEQPAAPSKLADFIANHMLDVLNGHSLMEYVIAFAFDQGTGIIRVAVKDILDTYEEPTKGYLKFGEQYRYDDYIYVVTKSKDNKLTLTFWNALKSNEKSSRTIPETVDLSEVTRLITTANSLGWEKTLEVADIDQE